MDDSFLGTDRWRMVLGITGCFIDPVGTLPVDSPRAKYFRIPASCLATCLEWRYGLPMRLSYYRVAAEWVLHQYHGKHDRIRDGLHTCSFSWTEG